MRSRSSSPPSAGSARRRVTVVPPAAGSRALAVTVSFEAISDDVAYLHRGRTRPGPGRRPAGQTGGRTVSDDTSLDLTEILAVDDEVTRSTGSDGFGVTAAGLPAQAVHPPAGGEDRAGAPADRRGPRPVQRQRAAQAAGGQRTRGRADLVRSRRALRRLLRQHRTRPGAGRSRCRARPRPALPGGVAARSRSPWPARCRTASSNSCSRAAAG